MFGYEMKERLIEHLGVNVLLEELTKSMSEKEQKENFEFIARMWDINLEDGND